MEAEQGTTFVDLRRIVYWFETSLTVADEPLRTVPLRSPFSASHAIVQVGEIDGTGVTGGDGSVQERQPPLLQVQRRMLGNQPRGMGAVRSDKGRAWPPMLGDLGFKPGVIADVHRSARRPLPRSRRVGEHSSRALVAVGAPK